MADCTFDIQRTTDLLVKGDNTTFEVSPPLAFPCTAKFYVGNEWVNNHIGKDLGDLHISAVSANSVSVRALSDDPAGTLRVEVTCGGEEPCGPTSKSLPVAGRESTSYFKLPSKPCGTGQVFYTIAEGTSAGSFSKSDLNSLMTHQGQETFRRLREEALRDAYRKAWADASWLCSQHTADGCRPAFVDFDIEESFLLRGDIVADKWLHVSGKIKARWTCTKP